MSIVEIDRIHKLTVDQVLAMVDGGILEDDAPVELLEGVLVEMSPQGPRHAFSIGDLADRLHAEYASDAFVREGKPLIASDVSLTEPDIAVVRGARRDYADRHPSGVDTLLVVEVAFTSQTLDRRKAAIYAAADAPVYWMLDLAGRRLIVCEQPANGEYGLVRILGEGDEVTLPGRATKWSVGSLLT